MTSPLSAEGHAAYKPLQKKWTLLAFFSECSSIPKKKKRWEKKSLKFYLISWKSQWGSEGVLRPCICIAHFTAVITPIPELGKSQNVQLILGNSTDFPTHSLHCTKISAPPYCVHWHQTHPIACFPQKPQCIPYIWSATFQSLPVLNSHRIPYILIFLTSKTKVTPSTVLSWPEANSLRSWAQHGAYHCSIVGAEHWRTTGSGNVKMHHTCKKKENKPQTCIFWSWRQTNKLH